MDLHKIHHPDNFSFIHEVTAKKKQRYQAKSGRERFGIRVDDYGNDIFRLEVEHGRWPERASQAEFAAPSGAPSRATLEVTKEGGIVLGVPRAGKKKGTSVLVEGAAASTFGVSGDAWMLRLVAGKSDRFFGMGEKWGPLERGGKKSQFWNTDVWADFHPAQIADADIDSPYASIPYLILERDGVFVGILVDNPHRVFMATNPRYWLDQGGGKPEPNSEDLFYFGAFEGAPIVYFLVGPTLLELTQKLQKLVGTTPRPPLWALGHQQCRWGYAGEDDLKGLDEEFRKHDIPCDGLWLDIDYMDGYRVFTLGPKNFSGIQKSGPQKKKPLPELQKLRERGRRIVPILDPGVKVDPGYRVYEEGLAGRHFCLAPSGRPYTGVVWPGLTHFPDFSLERTRRFWSNEVAEFVEYGFDGFWIDMNDPSTGPIDNASMLFDRGRKSHSTFHNQYAWGMARATRAGLERARPNERPFVLSRSASTGMARYAALWTGDNVSSFTHLKGSIPTSLNLALSGVPFNGPDVPGFGDDATEELAERWYQAGFLFPFLRNHSIKGSRVQEPWTFGEETLRIIRRYVRLRYRLLPYLYQAFVEQERAGTPILAPVFLGEPANSIVKDVEDEFLIGPSLLQAPLVESADRRRVRLPSGKWFCLREGKLHEGASEFDVSLGRDETPLFVRSGTLLPVASEAAIDEYGSANAELLRRIELHVFLADGETARLAYEFDDGISLDYAKGQVRSVEFEVRRKGGRLLVDFADRSGTKCPVAALGDVCFVDYGGAKELVFRGRAISLEVASARFTGRELPVRRADVTLA